ncbi:restriction endonuclease subunit S [Lactobacillus delbrueckii]|uniref:restriction endonuclease subunit S n=1 Tax=Lactobacillus delbrueckii TaxID=1584 RepID=UPI00070CF815|nr:restriction endonuclease subunit S [Lactobacillus delbrueckii]
MGDVCEEVSGNNGNVKGLPILTISAANGWMNQKDRFSQVIAGNELKKYTLLEKGHLAYNHGNSKLAKYGTVFVQNLYDQALVPRVYHSFKMKVENNPYYVEYYFAAKKLDRELARLVTSGARMDGLLNINKKDFFKIKFEVPTPVEQSLISTILQKLDQTITLHEEKKRQLEHLKSALLQKMFADKSEYPAIRFEGFSAEWEQRKLGDVCEPITDSIDTQKYPNEVFAEYSMPAFDASMKPDIVLGSSMNSVRKIITRPCLLVNKLNVRKKRIWYVKKPNKNAVCSAEFIPLHSDTVDLTFLNQVAKSETFTRYLENHSSGSSNSQKRITPRSLMLSKLHIPTIEEQKLIGKIFEYLDHTITLHDQKLSFLKRLKQTLLQKMFI